MSSIVTWYTHLALAKDLAWEVSSLTPVTSLAFHVLALWFPHLLIVPVSLFGRPHRIFGMILVKFLVKQRKFIPVFGELLQIHWESTMPLESHKPGCCLHCILLKTRFFSHTSIQLDIHLNDPTFTLLKMTIILKTECIFTCIYRNTLLLVLTSTVTGFQPLPLKQIVDVKGRGWSTVLLCGKYQLIS